METYKITFITKDGDRTVNYNAFDSLAEAGEQTAAASKAIKDLQAYGVEKVVVDMEGYLTWLYSRPGVPAVLERIAQFLYFDDGEYDEDKDVGGGDMVELVAGELTLYALTVEDYLKDRDIPEAVGVFAKADIFKEDNIIKGSSRREVVTMYSRDLPNMASHRDQDDCGFSVYRGVLVQWDEDHDERVLDVLDDMPAGIRESLLAVQEHEGGIAFVWQHAIPCEYDNDCGGVEPGDGDWWCVESRVINSN